MERWGEIWTSIKKNKLRTVLTGFSIAWGIFMLVVLMGVGTGLKNGTRAQFSEEAVHSVIIRSGHTSVEHEGLKPGRSIQFRNRDFNMIRDEIAGIEYATARWDMWQGFSVSYKSKSGTYTIRGVHPEHRFVENADIIRGRFINEVDQSEKRKTAVIDDKIRIDLFGEEDPLGQWIDISGIPFQVIGLFIDEGNENQNKAIYLPLSTAQLAFNQQDKISRIIYTTGDKSVEETQEMVDQTVAKLAEVHHFSKDDPKAVHVYNMFEEYERITKTLTGMQMFIMLIGLMTILAGLVGVSNIMIITVKERTHEIGIRKALGATPMSIIRLVLFESLVITSFFGYLGLLSGVLVLEITSRFITGTNAVFMNPEIDFATAIGALIFLVIAGALAGLVPARKAAGIKPVEAIRTK